MIRSWLGKRRRAEYPLPLRLRSITAPLIITADGVLGAFVLGPPDWEFATLDERINVWDQIRSRLGQLAEGTEAARPFQLRVTTRPYPAYGWAAELDNAAVAPLPQADEGESWDDYLGHGQARLRSTGLDQKLAMVAVGLWPAPSAECVEDLAGVEHPRKEAVRVLDELAAVTELLRGGGLNARPATSEDIAFLLHRSLSMGVPAPAHLGGEKQWDPDSLGDFTGRSSWVVEPFGSSVEVRSEAGGIATARHVIVLTTGSMPDMTWPESGADPWLLASDRLGFPVEASVSGELLRGSMVESAAVFEQRRATATATDYGEHGMTPPPAVERAIWQARETLDEVTEGTARTTARFAGTVRLAVHGTTLEEVEDRARKLVALYADLRIPLTRTRDQPRALREFVPGEPRAQAGYQRRMGMGYLAASAPHIDPVVGTPSGPYIGYTSLSHRAVLADLHYSMERLNRPGMFPVIGEPGSGKSVLLGSLAYSAARAGELVTVLDPSGPLAALTRLPALAPFAREINLMQADPGALSPPQLIPSPSGAEHEDDVEYFRAVKTSRAERSQLSFDILRQLLSPGLVRVQGVDQRLSDAVRHLAHHRAGCPETAWNLRWAISHLKGRDELATQIAAELEAAADFPRGNLIIPDHDGPVETVLGAEKTLTVITMAGLEPPPVDIEREFWGLGERYALPLLQLAAFFAARGIYTGDRDARKHLYIDEGHLATQSPSGRALMNRASRDTRKHNTAFLFASQAPQDPMAIGRMDSLMGGCFVGRLSSDTAARAGCELAGVSPEYAPVLGALESGEFVHRDALGRKAKMRVDMEWHPDLASLSTTPGHARPEVSDVLPPAPFLDPRLMGEAA